MLLFLIYVTVGILHPFVSLVYYINVFEFMIRPDNFDRVGQNCNLNHFKGINFVAVSCYVN